MSTAILIASGKGGTGKSSITAAVASCLAAMGHKTLCVDLDIGLRNLDLCLGLSDRALMDFTDVMSGRCTLERAAVEHPRIPNLHLLTAPLREHGDEETQLLWGELMTEARGMFDYILLDAPAGLGTGFLLGHQVADRGIIVSTTDANALRDASRCVTKLSDMKTLHLVMNRVEPKLLRKLHTTIDEAMDEAGLPLLGVVPEDEAVPLAAGSGTPLVLLAQDGAARACLNIAKRILGLRVPLMRIRA